LVEGLDSVKLGIESVQKFLKSGFILLGAVFAFFDVGLLLPKGELVSVS
jgi:hypothetical protein